MRVRLVHTLSLWLLAAVGITVLAMGGVTAWNLGEGFTAYLKARDEERLNQFALVVAGYLQDGGSTQALQQDSAVMPTLLRELARREGAPDPGGPPGTPPESRRAPPAAHGDRRADHRFGDDLPSDCAISWWHDKRACVAIGRLNDRH
jgi:hypothetical protein